MYSVSHYSRGTVCIHYHTARCVVIITEDGVYSVSHGTVCIFFIEAIVYITDHRGLCGYSSSEGTVCIFIITGDSVYNYSLSPETVCKLIHYHRGLCV